MAAELRCIMKTRINSKRIYIYILKEFLISFLVAFLFFFFIFFVNQLLVMAEEIFSKKVPFGDVLLFIIFSLPSIVALAFPFGSLVGALMAVGRLSSDNEILAFQASGIPLSRIFLPLLVMGILLSLVSFTMNDYFLPLGNIRLSRIYRKILYTNPGIELAPYSIKRYENTTIITGNIRDNKIENIIIIDKSPEKQKRIIKAKTAYLEESKAQPGVVSLILEDVFSHLPSAPEKEQFEYTISESMIYNILLKNISVSFINPGPREMSSVDVWREIQVKRKNLREKKMEHAEKIRRSLYELAMEVRYQKDQLRSQGKLSSSGPKNLSRILADYEKNKRLKVSDRNLRLYKLEYYKKYSIPISCLIFIIFAFPVGLFARKSGRSVGFGIGLFMSALYWGLLFMGHSLGIRLELAPFIAMWMPNFTIILIGGIMLYFRLRR
ncbi:hypothetical protein ES703_59954 [subsurface metagenome]